MTPSGAMAQHLLWPLSRLGEGLELLGARVGAGPQSRAPSFPGVDVDDQAAMVSALARVLAAWGRDVEPAVISHERATRLPSPAIVRVPATTPPTFLLIASRSRTAVLALGIDRRWLTVPAQLCADLLQAPGSAEARADIDRLLERTGIPETRRPRVAAALLSEALAGTEVAQAWRVTAAPGSPFGTQLRVEGLGRAAIRLVLLHILQVGCWMGAWALLGQGLLDGHVDWGWMAAWTLLLITVAPLQARSAWTQGTLATGLGRLLKARLLVGALSLDTEPVRANGAGAWLGRVLESDAVESLAISGGLQAALAVVELLMAAGVLALGPSSGALLGGLAGVTLVMSGAAAAYVRRRAAWSDSRLHMTNRLVEHISGHRTRLSQQEPGGWHAGEDRDLDDYVGRSHALDRVLPLLLVLLPRGWLVFALSALVPAFVAGSSPRMLALALGGTLVASLALRRVAEGLSHLSGAAVSWREVRPIFEAAGRREHEAEVEVPIGTADDGSGDLLVVRDVSSRHPDRETPVLAGCTLSAASGDRLLIRGPSGGGKSTFASIVAGLRRASSGLVLVRGLDRGSLGMDGWRRRVASAPQFHQNHLFCETLAFNLLIGRAWPPSDADLAEAEAVAIDLGLGDLLDRMPARLMQVVGEGGWQLSHGERSRVFMARTLLQGAEVMVLDESFAALDPATLREALHCVLRRAPTLLVIAHP